jgi:hypothetical protein
VPRKKFCPGCRRGSDRGRQHGRARERECPDSPAWSETLACADALCTGTGLPTGHPLWPARRGTCPVQVLEAQEISGNSQRVGPPGQSIMRTGQAACQRYREVSCSANDAERCWSAAGRRGADAADVRAREVRPGHSVRWAAPRSGGFKSLRRSDEERCIQKRG